MTTANVAATTRCLRRGAALGVALFALIGALPPVEVGASKPPPIKTHVTLSTRRVVAGHPIKGTVVLTNTTQSEITGDTCAENGWLAVGLSGRVHSEPFGSFAVACPPTIRLEPGANRFPVTVITTYAGCQQPEPAGTPQWNEPVCVMTDGQVGAPPLPAGRYSTKLHLVGLEGQARPPNRVVVTLTAPAAAPVPAPCTDKPGGALQSVTVPDVVGLSASAAASSLAAACLNAGYASPVGTRVASESPVGGTLVPEHSTVVLATRAT